MMLFKKMLSLLLALAMLLSAACVAQAAPAPGTYHLDGDTLYMEGNCFDTPVWSLSDATLAVQRAADLLRAEAPIRFEPHRIFTDTAGNLYYVFLQMVGDTTDYGGAVKVVTDPDGEILGVTASVERELPEGYIADAITADAAEQVVARAGGAALVPDATEQTLLPLNRDVDMESEAEKEEWRTVWAVYTENPDPERPYRVHYVTLGGDYLYDMPVKAPGDEASLSGYDAAYAFDNMEPADYTGKVTLSDGSTRELTVTLMRDMDTGVYYLGNLERRIAVADCYEMLYNKGHVVLESSPDNTGWDDTCLISLYNYIRAWDFYNDIGFNGGDGRGTPTLILKDFCDREHNPVDNAAYVGQYYGWQMFLSSSVNDMGQCLDVLAHEFTHCVTHAVMTHNAYKNDYGAINEAISDIQGNLCEMTFSDTTDTTWQIAENSRCAVRSMSDPHRFLQPEYTWDLYYCDLVRDPTDINDRGGVHNNSSLLNNVAYRLCADGGMTLAEAHAFWFAVDCAMVPGTDYPQLRLLLPWVMRYMGLEKYLPALDAAMEATRLGENALPEAIPDNRALVTLALPDEERFTDGNWMLVIPSADLAGALQRIRAILNRTGDYAAALDELEAMVARLAPDQVDENGRLKPNADALIDRLFNLFDETNAQRTEEDKALAARFRQWFQDNLSDVLCVSYGSAGADGRTIRMMTQKGLSLPLLLRLDMEPNSMLIRSLSLSVYLAGGWIDLTAMLGDLLNDPASQESLRNPEAAELDPASLDIPGLDLLLGLSHSQDQAPEEEAPLTLDDYNLVLDRLEALGGSMSWLADMFFYTIPGGQTSRLPADGLPEVTLLEGEVIRNLLVDLQSAAEQQP